MHDTISSTNNNAENVCFNRTDCLLDASAVCSQGLRTVEKCQKMHATNAALASILLAILLGLSYSDMSGWARFALNLVALIITLDWGYALAMAIIFGAMEHNSILAAKLGLERLLEEVRESNARYFEEQNKKALNPPKQ